MSTLAALQTRVRERGEFESTNFVTDAHLVNWINEAYLELWDLVAAAYKDHFYNTASFTLTGGTEVLAQYSLPADFYQMRLLELDPGTSTRRPVPAFALDSKDDVLDIGYRLLGGVLQIEPYELAGRNFKLYYVPGPTLLAAGTDSVNAFVVPWEEYLVIVGTIKARVREETDTSDLQAERMRLQARIESMAPSRNAVNPERVREVYNRGGVWPPPWRTR